ncbi:MAG: Multidrug resistance protein MdtK [Legionellaceae bacterium]
MFLNKEVLSKTKKLLLLSIPYTGAFLLTAATEELNTYILARHSPMTLGASGLISITGPFILICNSPLLALPSIVSELYGKKEKKSLASIIQQGWMLVPVLCIPQAIVMALSKPFLELLNQPKLLIEAADSYFYIRIASLPAVGLLGVSTSYAYGRGKKLPIFALNAFNLIVGGILTSGLVLGNFGMPRLGIKGYALATVAQTWLNNIAFAIYLKINGKRYKYNFFTFKFHEFKSLAKRFAKLGSLITVNNFMLIISAIYKQALIGNFGEQSIIASQIVNAYAGLPLYINDSISQAVSTLIGQSIGKRDYKAVKHYDKIGLFLAIGSSVAFSIPCFTIPQHITSIFLKGNAHHDEKLINNLFYLNGIQSIFDSISQILTGAFLGTQESSITTLISTGTFLLITLPMTLGLYFGTDLDLLGVALSFLTGSLIKTLLMSIAWHKKLNKLTQKELEEQNPTYDIEVIEDTQPIENSVSVSNLKKFSIFNCCQEREEQNTVKIEELTENEVSPIYSTNGMSPPANL